jgi:hypothetical protein
MGKTTRPPLSGLHPNFGIAVAALGIVVSATVVPGVFTVDENNYLANVIALRQGRLTVANTEGLPASRELLYFDPGPWTRAVDKTPVASSAPYLYAPIALPFSYFGWRGLVALNTLSYLAVCVMVFVCVRRYSDSDFIAWLGAAAFALGGFSIEYAQGVWPHMLSVALCLGGILSASCNLDRSRWTFAAAAGLLLGIATGVRYQNVVILVAVAAGIALYSTRRWRMLVAFSLAAALPLAASSAVNQARLSSWNPISKGPGYLTARLAEDATSTISNAAVMFWARLVDFSWRPELTGRGWEGWMIYDAPTGAHLVLDMTVKKALLQSAPWMVISALLMAWAWSPFCRLAANQVREVRLFSIVAASVMAMFAVSGVTRDDGMNFNQRYLLELVPLAAIAFAWALTTCRPHPVPFIVGSFAGVSLVLMIMLGTPPLREMDAGLRHVRVLAILKTPLILASLLAASWVLMQFAAPIRGIASLAVGVCMGWALALHVTDDVVTSHVARAINASRTEVLARVAFDGSAIVGFRGNRTPAGGLLLTRDVVVLDADADDAKDAPELIRTLHQRGRKVFVIESGWFPPDGLKRVTSGFATRQVGTDYFRVLELSAPTR